MARPVKTILKSGLVRRFACWLAASWIRFVHLTSRWEVRGGDKAEKLWNDGQPFIVAFWHNRLMMISYAWRKGVPFNMLISQHRDGELIANTIAHLGFQSIRGSSSRDGAAALRALVKALKSGESIGITPDGPRGPRMRASDGVVSIARLAGVPVLPITVATTRRKVLGSWDRFLVALPFSRGIYIWGDPVTVNRTDDPEDIRLVIEQSLTELGHEADRICGQALIEPAEVPAEKSDDQADPTPSQGVA